MSNTGDICNWVPMGSTLGAIYFNVLINDIVFNIFNGDIQMNADDTWVTIIGEGVTNISRMVLLCREEITNGVLIMLSH